MKKNPIFKMRTFYLGLFLFAPGAFTLYSRIPFSTPYPEVIIFSLIVAYIFNEHYKRLELANKAKPEDITRLISLVGSFGVIGNQRVRANIFKPDTKVAMYKICYHHNMDSDNDRDVEIPFNMGCTGEAHRTGVQIFCADKRQFIKPGTRQIPDEQAAKLKTDLEWICSTPIIRDGDVLAILNIDGDKLVNDDFYSLVKQFSVRCARLLSDIL
jgi:hypothetical protein